MRDVIFSIFLLWASLHDLKRRRIPVRLLILFAAAGIGIRVCGCAVAWHGSCIGGAAGAGALKPVYAMISEILPALVPGCALLAITGASRGAVGAGDGCFFLAAGGCLPWREIFVLLVGGLFCCSACGMGWIVFGRIKGVCMRNKRLPFLPFLIPVWIGILCFR